MELRPLATPRARCCATLLAVLTFGCVGPRSLDTSRAPSPVRPPVSHAANGRPAGPPQASPAPARGQSMALPHGAHSACPHSGPGEVVGALASDELDEVSGLVASRRHPGLFWVHNDSGDSARVFAIDLGGELRAEVALEGAGARDYEDIAVLPSRTGADTLVVADTGDNLQRRERVQLYVFAEPELGTAADGRYRLRPRRIEVRYEDGPRDVETLLADPITGDLFLVEKGPLLARREPVGVYRIAASDAAGPSALARLVAKVPLGPVTAGDILPDGSGLALRNYTHALFWPRLQNEPLERAFAGAGCALALPDRGEQGEAFAFTGDGRSFLTVAEGERAPIHRAQFEAGR